MLCTVLEPERHTLFGEWMAAKHSIHYTKLPAYFIAFDVFDKIAGKFLARGALREFLEPTGIPIIHTITEATLHSAREVLPFLETISIYGAQRDGAAETVAGSTVEGVYLRVDDGDWLSRRCKVVRPDFIQGIEEHWMTRTLVKNQVSYH